MRELEQITQLSHEFGGNEYVIGGGGNTSVKDEKTLWVKPSGTTLSNITPSDFVALDREKIAEMYNIEPPSDTNAREALAKDTIAAAVLPSSTGRASVEAPLHNALQYRYVVHTHPALVNGMTCAANGAETCKKLFPDTLWVEFIDPGYKLSMVVRERINEYASKHSKEPAVIFLKNHGVFAAGDSPEEIRNIYAGIDSTLAEQYKNSGISTEFKIADVPEASVVESAKSKILKAFGGGQELFICASGYFDHINGPLTPDHIVYAKSYFFVGEPSEESVKAFKDRHNYLPAIIIFNDMVFGIANTEKKATLVLETAQDAALVKQLAESFGGLEYMTERARQFIENWEVESYRSKQV